MGVRYEERSADGREFRNLNMCEGKVEAGMRTSERHESSEKIECE